MAKKKAASASAMLTEIIIKGLQDKKGIDIVSIDLRKFKNAVCDYYIVCHGTSRTHVETLANAAEMETKEATGTKAWHSEGFENSEWILLDYADVVVHIFQEATRTYFNLEGLWADAPITKAKT